MKTNLLTLMITLVIGIILAGSLLMPVIDDAQKKSEPTLYSNNLGEPLADYTNEDLELIVNVANDEDGYAVYVNGHGFAKPTINRAALISDNIEINLAYSTIQSCAAYIWSEGEEQQITYTDTVTVTYSKSSHEITLVGDETITVPATFIFVWDPNGAYGELVQYSQIAQQKIADQDIANNLAGVFFRAGEFTVGEITANGLIVASKYGVIADFDESLGWTAELIWGGTLTLVDGSYDVHTGYAPIFRISDANGNSADVTPYNRGCFILNEAHGHANSGAAHDMYGAIPIIVIVGLIFAASAAIFTKRND